MGQAAVDLPDPKDMSTAHAGGADDLLAQLAGDEIDRLLAESDVEPDPIAKLAPLPKLEPAPTVASLEAAKPAETDTHLEIPTVAALSANAPLVSDANKIDEPHPPALHDDVAGAATFPVWLKPLLWLNAPLDALPDPLRELIGKIAIATTANALAVLGYVALFRRHH